MLTSKPAVRIFTAVSPALADARRHADHRVVIVEPTWPAVDRARALIAAARLEPRVEVHHRSALRWIHAA